MKQYTKKDIIDMNPHDLLELALSDLERVEKDPKYEINMSKWHIPKNNNCYVCLAGSVLTRFLKPGDDWILESFESFSNGLCFSDYRSFGRCMTAINRFREGDIKSGCMYMDYYCDHLGYRVTPYSESPVKFKEDMRKILKMFKENPPIKKEV